MYEGGLGGGGGAVLGISTVAGGIAILPNTGGNLVMTILDIAIIAAGVLLAISFLATRVTNMFNR